MSHACAASQQVLRAQHGLLPGCIVAVEAMHVRGRGTAHLSHQRRSVLQLLHTDGQSGQPAMPYVAGPMLICMCTRSSLLSLANLMWTSRLKFKPCIRSRAVFDKCLFGFKASSPYARQSLLMQLAVASYKSVAQKLALAVKESDSEGA